MKTATVLNRKGGVGKTSFCYHLSGVLAKALDTRVLIVDADPQASLTQGFWSPDATEAMDPANTISAILNGDLPHPEDVIQSTGLGNLWIVPGSESADDNNVPNPFKQDRRLVESVRDFLATVEDQFDVCLIDCPPNLNLNSVAALVASDHLVIPMQPEDFGAQGIKKVMRKLHEVQVEGYPIELLGLVLNMMDARTSVHKEFERKLRLRYPGKIFESNIPILTDFKQAIARRHTIIDYKPNGTATKIITGIAKEFLARIDGTFGIQPTEEVAA